jgi:hypothetical protein
MENGGVAIFSRGVQYIEGQDAVAQMRIRVPKGTKNAAIVDGDGNVLAVIDAADMEDTGDGYLWGTVDVPVDTSKTGSREYAVVTDVDGNAKDTNGSTSAQGTDETEAKEEERGQSKKTVDANVKKDDKVVIDVLPPDPVPVVERDWILADACEWVDSNCRGDATEANAPKVAKKLAKYLNKDERVSTAKAYGSSVLFSNTNGVLHCVSLAPVTSGLLGSGSVDDHTYSDVDPAIDAFATYKKGKEIEPGSGITAGNTVTNGDVILLEPTPEHMDEDASEAVRKSCESFASVMDGEFERRVGDEALPAILSGELSESGIVVMRAHGIDVQEAGLSLLQMRSEEKNARQSWDDANDNLMEFIDSLESDSEQQVWGSFLGDPQNSDGWRCVVTARAKESAGDWDVGISITTNLIRQCYQKTEFDQSVLWLSSCGSLADSSFVDFALNHGAQIVRGYEGPVSEKADARSLCDMLDGLSTIPGEDWRNQSVGEVLDEEPGLTTQSDSSNQGGTDASVASANGNMDMFALGTGSLEGRVTNTEGDALQDVSIKAYRYFGNTFTPCGKTKTATDGTFNIDELPCGRYVLEVKKDDKGTT